MKVRITIMTENDKHVSEPKEKIERNAQVGWQMLMNSITGNGEKATVESVELVEM